MNYLILLYGMLLLLAALDLLPASKRMHNAIWLVAFAFTVVLCTIKVYYGPDNLSYLSFYEKLDTLGDLRFDKMRFEVGYVLFSSLMKTLGLSFWGMTAVVSLLYFGVVFALFRKMENYRVFALFILVVLDNRLFLMQYRECIAVTALMLAYLCYTKRKYIYVLLLLALVVLMHKSGIVFVLLFLLAWRMSKSPVRMRTYYIIIGLFVLSVLISPQTIVNALSTLFDDSNGGRVVNSILLHLTRAKRLQSVLLFYLLVMAVLIWQKKQAEQAKLEVEDNFLEVFVVLCMSVVAIMYPYYFILGRLRSYAIPFVILLIVSRFAKCKQLEWRQIAMAGATYCMICFFMVREIQFSQSYPSCAYKYTVFDTMSRSKEIAIRGAWKYDAYLFWSFYFQRDRTNEVKVKNQHAEENIIGFSEEGLELEIDFEL